MNKEMYNNVIEHTLKRKPSGDPLSTARAILTIWELRCPMVIWDRSIIQLKPENIWGGSAAARE